jgi:hypothetical protein
MTIFCMSGCGECANSLMNSTEAKKRHTMSPLSRPDFPHRRKPNGTFDSICTQCFLTIATADTEAELKAAERAHHCKGFNMGEIMHLTEGDRRPNRLQ